MLSFYAVGHERLVPVNSSTEAAKDAVWIDLLNPTKEEDERVEASWGSASRPARRWSEIEVSSRLYSENDALYMTATLLVGGQGPVPDSAPVTFILTDQHLVTVRYAEPGVFRTFVEQAQQGGLQSARCGFGLHSVA